MVRTLPLTAARFRGGRGGRLLANGTSLAAVDVEGGGTGRAVPEPEGERECLRPEGRAGSRGVQLEVGVEVGRGGRGISTLPEVLPPSVGTGGRGMSGREMDDLLAAVCCDFPEAVLMWPSSEPSRVTGKRERAEGNSY